MRRGNSSEVCLRKPWNTNGYSARGGSLATSIWPYQRSITRIGYLFLVFARRICIYCIGGTSRMGSLRAFSANRGRGGASGRAWKRIVPPANQGIEPPRFTPHSDPVFVSWEKLYKNHLHTVGSVLLQDTFLTSLNLHCLVQLSALLLVTFVYFLLSTHNHSHLLHVKVTHIHHVCE